MTAQGKARLRTRRTRRGRRERTKAVRATENGKPVDGVSFSHVCFTQN